MRLWLKQVLRIETLRDIGLEDECIQLGTPASKMKHNRWCRSLAGEELARVYSWGGGPPYVVRSILGSSWGICDILPGLR